MINLKRILRGLPKPDNLDPATAPYEQTKVLELIKHAIETGRYDFTSRRSIRIYALDFIPDGIEAKAIEVEWKLHE